MLDPSKAMLEKVCATWILFDEGVLPQIKVVTTATVGSFWWHQPKFPASIKWKPLYEFAMHLHFLIPPPKKRITWSAIQMILCVISVSLHNNHLNSLMVLDTSRHIFVQPLTARVDAFGRFETTAIFGRLTGHTSPANRGFSCRVKFQLPVCHRISVFIYIIEIW